LISKHCFKQVMFMVIQFLAMVHVFLLHGSLISIKQRFEVTTNNC